MTAIPAGPHTLRLSHPDKILFPEQGDTKQDLADYYFKIAPAMLPYLKDRPLSLQRFPGGIGEAGFYQKEIPETYPQWIQRARIPKREGGAQNQLLCQNAETLLYLVNQNCITPHAWLSRYPALERPDRLILDFDPPNSDTPAAQAGACRLHALLESRGIPHYAMSTGSRGFHVIIPLDGQADFDSARACARELAQKLVDEAPERYTLEARKQARGHRVFIDIFRNGYAQTSVPPFAVRAQSGAPVAVPLSWSEMLNRPIIPGEYTIHTVFNRLKESEAAWQELEQAAISVSALQAALRQ